MNRRTLFLGSCLFATAVVTVVAQQSGWPQFGGPQRNFTVETKGLAETWPAGGPRQVWSRPLGEGHSQVVVDGDRLFTMYGRGQQESVVALDRATGKTIWEKSNAAPTKGLILQVEPTLSVHGPHSTPLVAGNLLFTVGLVGKLQAFDKVTGNVVWSHDLWQEYKGTRLERGYTCSPIAYRNLVIVTVGGAGQALMAFDQKSGAVVWKAQSFRLAFSSPTLINVDGQDQLVTASADHVTAVDPNSGALLWQRAHPCGGFNITPPIWGADNILIISSAYECGSRALQLHQSAVKTTVKELWANLRLRVHHGSFIRAGDLVIGSSGSGPAPMTAVHAQTGAAAWQDRTFPKANVLYADGKLIVLDEDGQVALVRVSAKGMQVLARATVLTRLAWTPPTLAGTNLYVRDNRKIVALDLR